LARLNANPLPFTHSIVLSQKSKSLLQIGGKEQVNLFRHGKSFPPGWLLHYRKKAVKACAALDLDVTFVDLPTLIAKLPPQSSG